MRSIRPYAVFDRRSSPRERAVDGASIWKRHYVWQLASGGQVARDVVAISSVESQVCWTLTRIENYCLPPEFVTHKVERRDEVRITRNDGKCFGRICVGIAKKRCGEIDISTFLFDLYHMDKAVCGYGTCLTSRVYRRNPCLVLVVVPFDDIHSTMRKDGLKINVLPFDRHWIMRICLGPRDKVPDSYEFVVGVKHGMDEHGADKCCDVKPFASRAFAQQAMIEVASVYVCYSLHRLVLKNKRSQAFRPKTPLRVGRTVRLDMNLLMGSRDSVPYRRAWRKGGAR